MPNPLLSTNLTLATQYESQGNMAEASQAYLESLSLGREAQNSHFITVSAARLLEVLSVQGQLRRARAVLQQITASLDRRYGPDLGMAYVSMGEISRQSNQLDQAETYLSKGIELCQPFDARAATVVVGLISLAWLHQAQGDGQAAMRLLEEATQMDTGHFPYAAARAAANQAKLCLARGDVDAAARWADAGGLDVDDELSYLREIDYLAYARVLIAQGKLDPSLHLLARMRHAAETGHRMGRVIEIQGLRALAYRAQGDLPRALASLRKALVLAEPEGYIRLFADEGEAMGDLLRKAGARSIETPFYVRLMSAFHTGREETGTQ